MNFDDNKVKNMLDEENNQKKKINLKEVKEKIDTQTGEVTELETLKSFKVDNEPDYVKVYLNTICIFNGLSQSVSPVLFEFCKYMTWADNGQILRVDKYIKDQISKELNIKADRINKILKSIVDSTIFVKTKYRGVYKVNPYFIARGDWKKIKSLRGEFDFKQGRFMIQAEEVEEIELNQVLLED